MGVYWSGEGCRRYRYPASQALQCPPRRRPVFLAGIPSQRPNVPKNRATPFRATPALGAWMKFFTNTVCRGNIGSGVFVISLATMCRIEIHGCVFVCSPSGDHPFIGRQAGTVLLWKENIWNFNTCTDTDNFWINNADTDYLSVMFTSVCITVVLKEQRSRDQKRTPPPHSLPWDMPQTRPSSLFPKLVFMVYTTPPPSTLPSSKYLLLLTFAQTGICYPFTLRGAL